MISDNLETNKKKDLAAKCQEAATGASQAVWFINSDSDGLRTPAAGFQNLPTARRLVYVQAWGVSTEIK